MGLPFFNRNRFFTKFRPALRYFPKMATFTSF